RFGEVVGCDATVLRDRSGGPRETHGGNLARVACAGYSTRRDDLSVQGGVRAVVGEGGEQAREQVLPAPAALRPVRIRRRPGDRDGGVAFADHPHTRAAGLDRRRGGRDADPRGRAIAVVAIPHPDLLHQRLSQLSGLRSVRVGAELDVPRHQVGVSEREVGEAVLTHQRRVAQGPDGPHQSSRGLAAGAGQQAEPVQAGGQPQVKLIDRLPPTGHTGPARDTRLLPSRLFQPTSRAVTRAPSWVTAAFQAVVILCPLPRVKVRVQPSTVPALTDTPTSAVKPLPHWLTVR